MKITVDLTTMTDEQINAAVNRIIELQRARLLRREVAREKKAR